MTDQGGFQTTDPEQLEPLVAAGGWCAPSRLLYDVDSLAAHQVYDVIMPAVSVTRLVPHLFRPLTPLEQATHDTLQAVIRRAATEWARRRDELIEAAIETGMHEGWDVHVYERAELSMPARDVDTLASYQRLGIRFTEAKFRMPVLHLHRDEDVSWTDDDDWED